jgi:hypothetical protein
MPFPGEVNEFGGEADAVPTGHALIILVRQFEPGYRLRANQQAFLALLEKYTARSAQE